MTMKLPTPKYEIVKFSLDDIELQFRKITVGDADYINQLRGEGLSELNLALKILAKLLHGYDNTIEEREEFIKSLSIQTLSGDALENLKLLVGLEYKPGETKKKDKRVKASSLPKHT